MELILKYLTVAFASMFKFLIGPVMGYGFGLSFMESFIFTLVGMMSSVLIFSILGKWLKEKILVRFQKNKKRFTPKNRMRVRIWRKYGLTGIAFLTPLVLTPIVGTLISAHFGEHWRKIFIYMLISAVFWGLICISILYIFGDVVLHWIGH